MSNHLPKPQGLPLLTEEDVLRYLRQLLAHGFGGLEIEVEHHGIRLIRPKPVILGRRPEPTTR